MKISWYSVVINVLTIVLGTSCHAMQPTVQDRFPKDLLVRGTAGSLVPGEENYSIEINASGEGRYEVFLPDEPDSTLEVVDFEISDDGLEKIWTAILDEEFFSLEASYSADDIDDGSLAILIVTANGGTHQVQVENASVPAFERLLAVINELTPTGVELPYASIRHDRGD